ncbi:MAG: NAD-dependent epimerase/dehydratase family protein [Pirellulales bacterium]|nr:NAD-dependent epimerase/dehydratase family protein [Pirellulales bacterium]
MAKVLVTGASGFIGSHLVQELVRRGEEVSCLVRTTSQIESLRALKVRLFYGDVTDLESLTRAVAGHESVYHLAGVVKALTRKEYYRVNQGGMRNIARACAAATPPVLTIVSSLAACGPSVDGRPRVESDPPKPVSHYGWSKRYGEREVGAWAGRVPITVIRPSIVLGEGDAASLPMFRAVKRFGVHTVPGLGRNRFSLIHADDLVDLLIRASRRGRRLADPRSNGSASRGQGYYFAACEETPVYDDLGRLIAHAVGRRAAFPLHIATPLVWLVAGGVTVVSQISRKPQILNLDKAREMTAGSWICSAEAAQRELGFRVLAPLRERLSQTARWYQEKGWM